MKGKGTNPSAPAGDDLIEIDFVDVDRECPHFKHAVARQDGIFMIDEIEHIRVDLEILLSSAVARIQSLRDDLEICESGGVIPTKASSKSNKLSTKNRHGKSNDILELGSSPFKKRTKSFPSRPQPLSVSVGSSKSRTGKSGDILSQQSATTPSTETARMLHSKAVDQFWTSIESYCVDVTQSGCKEIEEYLASLGKTSSDGKKSPMPHKASSFRSNSSITTTNGQRSKSQPTTNLGPLTRRLVAALLEDNFASDSQMSSSADQFSTSTGADAVCGPPPSTMALARALDLGNTVALERRVRRILEKHDIFDSSESESDSGSDDEKPGNGTSSPSKGALAKDEVSTELNRCQEELKAATESNRAMLASLAAVAKSAAQTGSIKSQISSLETEIEEAYQRLSSAKQRKKAPNVIKREHEQFHQLLNDWKRLACQLEQLS